MERATIKDLLCEIEEAKYSAQQKEEEKEFLAKYTNQSFAEFETALEKAVNSIKRVVLDFEYKKEQDQGHISFSVSRRIFKYSYQFRDGALSLSFQNQNGSTSESYKPFCKRKEEGKLYIEWAKHENDTDFFIADDLASSFLCMFVRDVARQVPEFILATGQNS